MLSGVHLQLRMGMVATEPVPQELVESLQSVQVTENDTNQSGFQLSFAAGKESIIQRELLPLGFFDAPRRVIVVVTVNGDEQVLIDGVITRQELAVTGEPGNTTLTITGLDLSQLMDLIDFSGFPWPAMPSSARVAIMVAKYAMFGIIPKVLPSVLIAVSNPLDVIPAQRGTDLRYIKRLASQVGYVFFIEPGPAPGMSFAYWGPQIKVGEVQPALTVNMDADSNVESLNLSFDGIRKTLFTFFIREDNSGVSIPIPVPDIGPLNPPLGSRPPIPLSYTKLDLASPEGEDDSTAKFKVAAAASRGLARAAQRADVIAGSGSLDVSRYGRVLRARKLVGIRGAGHNYDGHYYVKSVTSNISPGEFKQSFRLTRNALGPLSAEVPV
ncbi:MAG: hypothetical protein GY753_09300 [Gammaproteobacteria bacterium]|nr:hypothetical protein [Gammaproteobacteria bacterium]